MHRFVNPVAIVTGAGDGIRRATALPFAAEGASVSAVDLGNGATAARCPRNRSCRPCSPSLGYLRRLPICGGGNAGSHAGKLWSGGCPLQQRKHCPQWRISVE